MVNKTLHTYMFTILPTFSHITNVMEYKRNKNKMKIICKQTPKE